MNGEWIKEMIILVASTLTGAAAILFLLHVSTWTDSQYGCVGKLKFRHFKGLYNANPNVWNLYSDSVAYWIKGKGESKFYFGIIDLLRYQRWRSDMMDTVAKKERNDEFAKCIELWQADLENYKNELDRGKSWMKR